MVEVSLPPVFEYTINRQFPHSKVLELFRYKEKWRLPASFVPFYVLCQVGIVAKTQPPQYFLDKPLGGHKTKNTS